MEFEKRNNPSVTPTGVTAPLAQGSQAGGESRQVIGAEEIRKATQTMLEYKNGKKNLEKRVIENEQWYKLRHWDYIREDGKDARKVEPVSAWLFNALANKHADAMDNFPVANILPREESDKEEAEKLTAIVPVVMEHCDYEQVYSDMWDDKLRSGTGIVGIFWNSSKLNGLGDIDIQRMDVLNLFWEPGIRDIQKSKHFFSVELWDREQLQEQYPQLRGSLTGNAGNLSDYVHDDAVKKEDKVLVVDWYYKKRRGGRTLLHYCKYVGETVLFATENEPDKYPNGWYDHGRYPFDFDPLFNVKGSPCGFGYIDVGKSPQEYIDEGDQIIQKNMRANASPRVFSRVDGGVNEEEFADLSKDVVHYEGNPDSIIPIKGIGLNGNYITVKQNKIEELKETTGNRDASTCGTTSGVTSAAGLATMQEAGSKLSRDANKAAYRSFRRQVSMVVELIRQFYTQDRCFRITGKNGKEDYVRYNSKAIQLQSTGQAFGMEQTYRMPLFDIEISAQKQNPYSKLSQNDMAISFYKSGFFNPQNADQALACLEIMDFDRKQFVMDRIQQNGTMFQQLQKAMQQIAMLSQIVEELTGEDLAGGTGGGMIPSAQPVAAGFGQMKGLSTASKEPATVRNARQRAAQATSPT